jgi:tetratricopeptide (TPR) repeat protein
MEMGNFKEALAWYNKAITYYDSVEDRQMLGEVLENAGLCSGALDDYDNAFGSLMKAHMLGQKLSGRSFTLLGTF